MNASGVGANRVKANRVTTNRVGLVRDDNDVGRTASARAGNRAKSLFEVLLGAVARDDDRDGAWRRGDGMRRRGH